MAKKPPAATPAARKPAAKKPPALEKPKRRRHDWQAIERDYRTGSFTLMQLEAKHGAGYAEISRRAKKEGWTQDLRKVVRQATNAAVIAETTKATTKEVQKVADVVMAAAEIGKEVILRHRSDILDTRNLAADLLGELREATHKPETLIELARAAAEGMDPIEKAALINTLRDALKVHNRIASVHKLSDTLTKLQTLERRAFNLDESGSSSDYEERVRDLQDELDP